MSMAGFLVNCSSAAVQLQKKRLHTCCECYNKRGYIRSWYVYNFFFFIFRLMRFTDVCFFHSRTFCFRVNRLLHNKMKPSNTTTSGKATDMIAGICTFPRLPCQCTKRHVMLNPTSAAAAATALRTAGWSCSVFFFFFFQLSCESYMVMDVVQNPQTSSGYDQGTTMRKNT